MPKVTVLMSVFNDEKYVAAAINSVFGSTFKDFEFVIIDDFSTDRSGQILKEYADLHDNIVLLKNEKNLGLATSLNRGIEIARGEYIMRIDSDDMMLPDRIAKQVDFLDKNMEFALCGGSAIIIDENEKEYGIRGRAGEVSKTTVFKGSAFIHPSVTIRTATLLDVNGYTVSPLTRRTEDYDKR